MPRTTLPKACTVGWDEVGVGVRVLASQASGMPRTATLPIAWQQEQQQEQQQRGTCGLACRNFSAISGSRA